MSSYIEKKVQLLEFKASANILEFDNIKNHTTLLTSVVLITGLIILYAGVIYSKNVDKLRSFIESKLPEKVRNYLPQNRA